MKCFNHGETEAVAVCKNCGKGVCHECAIDLGKGIACNTGCEEDVKYYINNSVIAFKKEFLLSPVFILVIGALLIALGFSGSGRMDFMVYAGVGFIVYKIFR